VLPCGCSTFLRPWLLCAPSWAGGGSPGELRRCTLCGKPIIQLTVRLIALQGRSISAWHTAVPTLARSGQQGKPTFQKDEADLLESLVQFLPTDVPLSSQRLGKSLCVLCVTGSWHLAGADSA